MPGFGWVLNPKHATMFRTKADAVREAFLVAALEPFYIGGLEVVMVRARVYRNKGILRVEYEEPQDAEAV